MKKHNSNKKVLSSNEISTEELVLFLSESASAVIKNAILRKHKACPIYNISPKINP
jgi:hypothetical protein